MGSSKAEATREAIKRMMHEDPKYQSELDRINQ
jgi:hypothetical protein